MNSGTAALDGVSVVVRGFFTPSLFSPAWLLGQQLIGPREFEAAEVEVIARELCVFQTGWLSMQVNSDALQISTADVEEFERLRDAASGVLRALVNTQIAAIGINRERHFRIESADRWHDIGDLLTPKERWEEHLALPGMRSLTIWGVRPDDYAGRVQVQVEPSLRVPQAVYVSHNDHFVLSKVSSHPTERSGWQTDEPIEPGVDRLPMALDILAQNWFDSLKRAQGIFDMVDGLGETR